MPSARRLRLLLIVTLAIVVMTLVYTAQLRANEDVDGRTIGDFIHRTKQGLDKAHGGAGGQSVLDTKKASKDSGPEEDEQRLSREMRERLKAAEIKAKDSANAKVLRPEKPEQVIGVGSSAGGQGALGATENGESKEMTDEEQRVESTINEILKKSPGQKRPLHPPQLRLS